MEDPKHLFAEIISVGGVMVQMHQSGLLLVKPRWIDIVALFERSCPFGIGGPGVLAIPWLGIGLLLCIVLVPVEWVPAIVALLVTAIGYSVTVTLVPRSHNRERQSQEEQRETLIDARARTVKVAQAMDDTRPRDLIGYGRRRPRVAWPGGARIAVSFVLNYEEGGERNVMDGDPHAEVYVTPEIAGMPPVERRNFSSEEMFEYGSRSGFWRLLRVFGERDVPFTSWAVGLALKRNPEAGIAMAEAGHEVASHSWRWIDYAEMPEDEEREDIRNTVQTIREITGSPPLGWYTGRFSPNTRRLVMEETETLYDSDSYNDDLPYWTLVAGKPRLIVPYALDTNDFKFALSPGWTSGEDFFTYLKAAFDHLYREGETEPKMMSVGLHCRLTGRPARAEALARFIDYLQMHERVWICRRIEIARHWVDRYPAPSAQ